MTEQEFDIQVRNLLQQATEEVPSGLWESVVAGLDRKRRIVPLRFWGSVAAVAAAAAVVAGVVFLHPAAVPTDHSNPSISIAQAPVTEVEVAPVTVLEPVTEAAKPSSRPVRLAQAAPVKTESVPAMEEASAPVVEEPSTPPAEEHAPKQPSAPARPVLEDQSAQWARLAFEDSPASFEREFSLTASGNMQNTRHGGVSSNIQRPYAAPVALATEGIYNESPEASFSLPFSVGIGAKYSFAPHWSVGIGVRYTYLGRSFVGDYVGTGFRYQQTDIVNHQHWLGIPVHAYYEFLNRGPWRVHGFVGMGVEFLLDNDYLVHGFQKDVHYHGSASRPQWSGDAGVGVEFRVAPNWGIYLDPGFHYYFGTEWQPRSLRTVQPLRFDVELGVRFSFGQK